MRIVNTLCGFVCSTVCVPGVSELLHRLGSLLYWYLETRTRCGWHIVPLDTAFSCLGGNTYHECART